METPKEQAHRLANDLSKATTHEVDCARKLVKILYEQAKEATVSAMSWEETLRRQGEAGALDKLHKMLTRPPATTKE